MHKVRFFPLENADCCRIDLHDGRKILFDYANTRNPDDEDDRRCDLPALLTEDLESADKNDFDVVAFTHLDNDHVCGAPNIFISSTRRSTKWRGVRALANFGFRQRRWWKKA
jgi:glyoxylase-like metal-dependent hydrolase (beta-lactamase superfamily II)